MIMSNQAYHGGTIIGDGRSQILAKSPAPKEPYITATIKSAKVRQMRFKLRIFGNGVLTSTANL